VISVDFAHVTAPYFLTSFSLDSTQLKQCSNPREQPRNHSLSFPNERGEEGRIQVSIDSALLPTMIE
jgi:hypothetical protein